MELQTIEKLLEKYFDAATTVAEEQQLKRYFSSADVAPHLEHYKAMFGYFERETDRKFERQLPLKSTRRKPAWLSLAASVVLLLGMFAWFIGQNHAEEDLGTYDDPEIAFRETQKALNMLSHKVNVGVGSMDYLEEYEKSKETIFKK